MAWDVDDLLAFIEERYKIWRKIPISRFVSEELRFRDPKTGRFISREEAQRLIDQGIRPNVVRLYRAKETWESLGLKAGRFISKENYAFLKETIAEENRIRGFMRSQYILDRDEGVRRYYETVDLAEKLRKQGVPSSDINELFSP